MLKFAQKIFADLFVYGDVISESQEQTVFGLLLILVLFLCLAALSRIEVDTVGDSKEQVAVGDAVVLSHPHSDAVASWVDHGLEVSGGVDPVVDGTPGGVGF